MLIANAAGQLRDKGFTLVEVLVAILILSIGILGLAALESYTLQTNQSAYFRSQATILTYDLADKMRANRGADYWGVTASSHASNCVNGNSCDADTLAEKELHEWETAIQSILPSGAGVVSQAAGIISISIQWDDDRDNTTPDERFTVNLRL